MHESTRIKRFDLDNHEMFSAEKTFVNIRVFVAKKRVQFAAKKTFVNIRASVAKKRVQFAAKKTFVNIRASVAKKRVQFAAKKTFVNIRAFVAKNLAVTFLLVLPNIVFAGKQENPIISISGETQGTTYHIKYFDTKQRNLKTAVDSILNDFDQCLSLYRPDSELVKFNNSHAVKFKSPYFFPVLTKSEEIFQATNGAFDPTIFPLVEAYGFGPKKNKNPETANLDSLLTLVGFDKISFDTLSVQKSNPNIQLDFNGIAQGYAVDVIGEYLKNSQIERFMVEIGGEILCQGYKTDNQSWTAGIENPLKPGSLYCSVQLAGRAMTTAGNYRNHFEKEGQIFNHIINPKTGSMEQTSLLSVTVFAKDAITADGYDTAFFVMGLEETKRFLPNKKDIDVYMLYTDSNGKLNEFASDGIKNFIKRMK